MFFLRFLIPKSLQKPPVEEGVPEGVPEAVPAVEAVQEVEADLEEELGAELDEYDDVVYQGVDYLAKGDKLFNGNFELIGEWDADAMVATFATDEARDKHLAEKDSDDEE